MDSVTTRTLIIGASISGLATAAALQKKNIEFIIIEKEDQVAAPWRHHYDRLHLHTDKSISHLPYKKFPAPTTKYPSRLQFVTYLEDYRQSFHIEPLFNTEARSIANESGYWITYTDTLIIRSKCLVMATGAYAQPRPVRFKGIESFPGRILHSAQYKSGRDFKGQRVLVVGFGNSGCEIAIDLYEQGAVPVMSVRSAVNVIPRDLLGIPILQLSILLSPLPPRIADVISRPLINAAVGNLAKLGLKRMKVGPLEELSREGAVPVLDIGTIAHIREGHIGVRPGIDRIEGRKIFFEDGQKDEFDAVVAAIGYEKNITSILNIDPDRIADLRKSTAKQKYFGKDGLYFCGYYISPTGQIREISNDALRIAKDIALKT